MQEEELQIERELHAKYRTSLDPLLADLAGFDTSEELTQRIQALYDTLDEDGSCSLDFNELNIGLRRLKYSPPIHLSPEDFDMVSRTLSVAWGGREAAWELGGGVGVC